MPLKSALYKTFRLIALLCAFLTGVSQPIPAFALRPHVDQSGLEEQLGTAGLEETVPDVDAWTRQLVQEIVFAAHGYEANTMTMDLLEYFWERWNGESDFSRSSLFSEGLLWNVSQGKVSQIVENQLRSGPSYPLPDQGQKTRVPVIVPVLAGTLDVPLPFKQEDPSNSSLRLDPSQLSVTAAGSAANMVRVFAHLGTPIQPVGIVGRGPRGQMFMKLLEHEGVAANPDDWQYIQGETSVSFFPVVRDDAGRITWGIKRLIQRPTPWQDEERREYLERFGKAIDQKSGGVLVVSTRYPPNASPALLSDLVRMGKQAGLWTIVDSKPDYWRHSDFREPMLSAGPTLLKVNLEEFAILVGWEEPALRADPVEIFLKARRLMDQYSIPYVLVSADQKGALLISQNHIVFARAPIITVGSDVGAGDAALAALVDRYARSPVGSTGHSFSQLDEEPLKDLLRVFVAAGTETARLKGTQVAGPEGILSMESRVQVFRYDPVDLKGLKRVWDSAGLEEDLPLATQPAAKTLLESRPDFVRVPPYESRAPLGSDRFRTKDGLFQFAPMGDGMVLFTGGATEDERLVLEDRLDSAPQSGEPRFSSHRSLVVRRGKETLFSWQGEPGEKTVVVRGYDYNRRSRTLTVYLDPSRRPEFDPKSRVFKVSGSSSHKARRRATLRLMWAEPRPVVAEFKDLFIRPGEKEALDHAPGLHFYVTVNLNGKSDEMRQLARGSEELGHYGTDYILSAGVPDSTREEILGLIEGQIQGRLALNLPERWEKFRNWVNRQWMGRALLNTLGRPPRHFTLEPINLYRSWSAETQAVRFHGFLPAAAWKGAVGASAVLEFSNNEGRSWDWKTSSQTLPASAGLEETYFPPPQEVNSSPAETIWEAGSDVLPSDGERLARMAFEAPRGGPRQYLRLFASLNITLPTALRDERYGGKTLLSYLPDGATLNSGYINAIDEPFIRSRIRRLLADQGFRVRARVHLGRVDVEIPMSPINVWADGKIRYEGRVPAEDIRFHVDRSFAVEIYWNGQWHRLREEGRIRIEPPNPSQIAALSGPDDLGMGQHDAQEELRYARGLLAEQEDEETKKANEALLDAGIVTNQNLPPAQRAPYLGKLQSEGRLSPAEARKAFVAQQRAANVQKDGFFEGMQFKIGVSPSGDRWLLMYNPNRANTPKPMPGAAHPLSEEKPVQFKEFTGEVVTLRQRMLPVPTDRLDNPVKAKVNPYGYVWGHLTLPVTTQIAQSDWPEAVDAVVEQMWQQQSRLTVIGVNLGGKAAASLPDWAHAHDIPWRMPVDEVGDSEILWQAGEQGVRLGLLRDPFLTTFVFEGNQESSAALVAQAKSLVARLKEEGFGDYNAWGVVRPDGIGRLFVLPRNPAEPDPPADAADKKWKPADDYAKPIADWDYWSVELSSGQRRLMSRSEMERAGIPASKPPLVLKGRPVLEIKMGIMELRRFLIIPQLAIYEDPDLEARLTKSYELVGVPWSDPRIRQILGSIPAAPDRLGEDSSRQVRRLMADMDSIESADRLVALFGAVSEWRHRHVDAFDRLSGDEASKKGSFTAAAERQIERWAAERADLVREIPHTQGPVPMPDPEIPPVLAVALNPTLDRGVRVVELDGQEFLEVSKSAGGSGANLAQASSALGREAHLVGLFSGGTGERAVEALHGYGVAVHQIQSSESLADTRSSLMVASSRPGRRERRLVGEGAATPLGLIRQVQSLLESEPWQNLRYSLMIGERWVGDSASEVAREAADLARFAKGKGNEVHVTANSSWTPEIWETVLASSPDTVSSSLEALAKFLDPPGQIDRWRHRPEEAAQAVDALRRQFGIREWLVHFGAAGTVLVTDQGGWHVIPSPALRLTYLSGSTDVVDAAYLRYRSKRQVPADALAAGITAALLFMETNGIVPRDEEIRSRLFRAQVNVLPRPIFALGGLEEQAARALNLLAEARTGRGIVVVPLEAFGRFSGLEEFLTRFSVREDLSKSFVVWGDGEAVDRVAGQNRFLRIFRDPDPAVVSDYLAGLEEAESVHVLGDPKAAARIERFLSPRGISVSAIGSVMELLASIGVQTDALTQGGLEELQSDLFRVRGT